MSRVLVYSSLNSLGCYYSIRIATVGTTLSGSVVGVLQEVLAEVSLNFIQFGVALMHIIFFISLDLMHIATSTPRHQCHAMGSSERILNIGTSLHVW